MTRRVFASLLAPLGAAVTPSAAKPSGEAGDVLRSKDGVVTFGPLKPTVDKITSVEFQDPDGVWHSLPVTHFETSGGEDGCPVVFVDLPDTPDEA